MGRAAGDRVSYHLCIDDAASNGLWSGMRRPALPRSRLAQYGAIIPIAQGHRSEPHEAAISSRVRISVSRNGVAGALPAAECGAGRVADIEAGAGAAIRTPLPPIDEALHQVCLIDAAAHQQAVGEGQCHRGIIGPFARFQLKNAATDHVCKPGVAVPRFELERGANGVPDGQADQRTHATVFNGSPALRGRIDGDRLDGPDISLLAARFDGAGANAADHGDRLIGRNAQLHQQARGDAAGAAKPTLAMNEHVKAIAQPVAQVAACGLPFSLEPRAGGLEIGNRQMKPVHMPGLNGGTKALDRQGSELMRFNQTHNGAGVPLHDNVEIGVEIARPGPAIGAALGFAGAEGDADAAKSASQRDSGNLQRMGLTGFDAIVVDHKMLLLFNALIIAWWKIRGGSVGIFRIHRHQGARVLRKAVGFYWTLPVPHVGFHTLPKNVDEARELSLTIRYQCELVRRWAKEEGFELIHEEAYIELEPDRGSDMMIEGPLTELVALCRKTGASIAYVDFSKEQGWRSHKLMERWLERHSGGASAIDLQPIWPNETMINGTEFNPVDHFQMWRKRQEQWSAEKVLRAAAARVRATELRARDFSWPSAAKALNEEGISTLTGRDWTGDSLRKFLRI